MIFVFPAIIHRNIAPLVFMRVVLETNIGIGQGEIGNHCYGIVFSGDLQRLFCFWVRNISNKYHGPRELFSVLS